MWRRRRDEILPSDRWLVAGLIGISLLAGALATARADRRYRRAPEPVPVERTTSPLPASSPEDGNDFRLLLTVIAGVGLGAAAAALPKVMSASASGSLRLAFGLMWATGVVSVVLVYITTMTGADLLRTKLGLVRTSALVVVFMAICGMYASLMQDNHGHATAWWFVMFAAFAAAAVVAIWLMMTRLGDWWCDSSGEEGREFYRRAQRSDMFMAGVTAASSGVYIFIAEQPSSWSALVASSVALGFMMAACIKQAVDRRKLAEIRQKVRGSMHDVPVDSVPSGLEQGACTDGI